MTDFNVVDVPIMLNVQVTGPDGKPDLNWHREAAESQYVYAEFLAEKGLLNEGTEVSRQPNLVIRWTQLNEEGQAFTKATFHKWLTSVDETGTTEASKRQKFEKRWQKFNEA
jgi:hypothetical protein